MSLSGIKKSVVAGAVIILPIVGVVFLVDWAYSTVLGLLGGNVLEISRYAVLNSLATITASLILSFVSLGVLGFISRSYIGNSLENLVDRQFKKIPLLGRIYDTLKHASGELVKEGRFKQPVKVNTGNVRRPAYRTGNQTDDGKQVLFMPKSPNLTSGFVIEADPEDIEEAEEPPEEMIEKILTGGLDKTVK